MNDNNNARIAAISDLPLPVKVLEPNSMVAVVVLTTTEKTKAITSCGNKEVEGSCDREVYVELPRAADLSIPSNLPPSCVDQAKDIKFFEALEFELSSTGPVPDVSFGPENERESETMTLMTSITQELAKLSTLDTLIEPSNTAGVTYHIDILKHFMIIFRELDFAVHKKRNSRSEFEGAGCVPVYRSYRSQYYYLIFQNNQNEKKANERNSGDNDYCYIAWVEDDSVFFGQRESNIVRYSGTADSVHVLSSDPDNISSARNVADYFVIIPKLNSRIDQVNLELISTRFASDTMASWRTSRPNLDNPMQSHGNMFKCLFANDITDQVPDLSDCMDSIFGNFIHLSEILSRQQGQTSENPTRLEQLARCTPQQESPSLPSYPKAFFPSLVMLMIEYHYLVKEQKRYSKKKLTNPEDTSGDNFKDTATIPEQRVADFSAGETLVSFDWTGNKTFEFGVLQNTDSIFVIDCIQDITFVFNMKANQLRVFRGSICHSTFLGNKDDTTSTDGNGKDDKGSGNCGVPGKIDNKAVRMALYHVLVHIYGSPFYTSEEMKVTLKEKLDGEDAEWLSRLNNEYLLGDIYVEDDDEEDSEDETEGENSDDEEDNDEEGDDEEQKEAREVEDKLNGKNEDDCDKEDEDEDEDEENEEDPKSAEAK